MAKANDCKLAEQYLVKYLQNIQKRLDHCQMELTKHSQSYSIKALTFHQVELLLKEFVNRERKYLTARNNVLLNNFKDDICATDLFKTISTSFSQINPQVDIDIDLDPNEISFPILHPIVF